MKDHTTLCRQRAEKNKEIKDLDKRFNEKVFDAFMRHKEVNTEILLEQ